MLRMNKNTTKKEKIIRVQEVLQDVKISRYKILIIYLILSSNSNLVKFKKVSRHYNRQVIASHEVVWYSDDSRQAMTTI